MKTRIFKLAFSLALMGLFTGCVAPYNYANYRAHPPRSILVLPPLNESTDVRGTYGYLSTVTAPLAEMGYYVYPVAVVDQFLKENGQPTSGEMHQIPPAKIREIIGADAVLYVTLKQYGTKYQLINSATIVAVTASLVDTATGLTLWEGSATVQQNSSSASGGNIIADLIADAVVAAIDQAVKSSTDQAHGVCRLANAQLFLTKDHGLLYGPYSPKARAQ